MPEWNDSALMLKVSQGCAGHKNCAKWLEAGYRLMYDVSFVGILCDIGMFGAQ